MEKLKNKDGMLAAGKKRLEQFRQKKQGKGSASKHAKPETDLEHGGHWVDAVNVSSKGRKTKGSKHGALRDDPDAVNTRSDSGSNEVSIDLNVSGADAADLQINADHIPANVVDQFSAPASNSVESAFEQCREAGQEKPQIANSDLCLRIDVLEASGLDLKSSPPITGYLKPPIESESLVGGFESTVTMAPDLSTSMADSVVPNINTDHVLVNHDAGPTDLNGDRVVINSARSDHYEPVPACDGEQQSMNSTGSSPAEGLSVSQPVVLTANLKAEHGDEKASELYVDASNFEESALEQCQETGKERPQMSNSELCSKIDLLNPPSGWDSKDSPPITADLKPPLESELLVGSFDSNVSMATDFSTNMVDSVVPNVNTNQGLGNHDDGTTELDGDRVVMSSASSDNAEPGKECDEEQEAMKSMVSSAVPCLGVDQPVLFTANLNIESGDEVASELPMDAKLTQSARCDGQSCTKHSAALQEFPLQLMSRKEEKDTSRLGHEHDRGAGAMLPSFNTSSTNFEHMVVTAQGQDLSNDGDAETTTDYLSESQTKLEFDTHTEQADETCLAVSVSEVHFPPFPGPAVVVSAEELHCAAVLMGSGSEESLTMEQSQTGEMDVANPGNNSIEIPSDSNLNQVGLCSSTNCELKTSLDDSYHGMPVDSRGEMSNIGGIEESTVVDAPQLVDEILGLNCTKKAALSGDLADDSCSTNDDVLSVSPNADETLFEANLLHTSEESSMPNVVLDQNSERDVEGVSSSSGFHGIMEPGNIALNLDVNAEWTTAVEQEQEAIESVHVETGLNTIQESFSGNDSSCLHTLEAEQTLTGEDQILKASDSSSDLGLGSAGVMEMEAIVMSNACNYTTHEAPASESGSGVADSTMPAIAQIEADCKAALKPGVDIDPLDSGLVPPEKSDEVHGTVEEVGSKGLDKSITEVSFQLQMDKVAEKLTLEQNLTEDVLLPVIKTSSQLKAAVLDPVEYERQELACCNQELNRTKVILDCEIDEPDVAQHVVAVDNSSSDRVEELDDTLSGSSFSRHKLDNFAEVSASNTEDHRTDDLLSRNGYPEHKSENVSSPIKDDLPSKLLSRAVVHDHEADLRSDFINQFHSSLDLGLTLDSKYAENKERAIVSDGHVNDVKFIERNNERGQECSEVSQFGLAVQCESVILESCKSCEVVSSVGEYVLPFGAPDETLMGGTEHLLQERHSEECGHHLLQEPHSEDCGHNVIADTYQNDTLGLSVENTQERHSSTGQLSRSFDKSDLPFENVQEDTCSGPRSRGFDESTFMKDAHLGNKTNLALSVGAFQAVDENEEKSSLCKAGGLISCGNEGEPASEIGIREVQDALSKTEMENYALLLNSQAAKNNEERDIAGKVLTHVVKRLVNFVSEGTIGNENGELHNLLLKLSDVDNRGLEGVEFVSLEDLLQASNYWMDKLQQALEEKRQTEIMRIQLEDALLMKDSHIKGLTEMVKELSQNCDELRKDSDHMKDLQTKAMEWEELSRIQGNEIVMLSDKVSELSQNYQVAIGEVAKAVEERSNLEGKLKDCQNLYAEQESKAIQMEELLSIKDNDLERLFDKVAELSQNYDTAMSELVKSREDRLSMAAELNHFQRLSVEQEEGCLRTCKQAKTLGDKISALLGPSSIAVDAIHGDAMDTLESLVAALQGHYETLCSENKDLLLMAKDSEAAYQIEVNNIRALVSAKDVELGHLQEKVDLLTDELIKTRDDGDRKVQEAEQKALGVRERLSLAVTKGKGLVQQRDNLKQLLSEKTAEFETLSASFKQELHLKTAALNEVESRVKLNSEAVERVEALESELSYIRNSANALRESFLQKDAVLQKIEELLEDANLPEALQMKDIYEKIEWYLEANTQKTSTLEGQGISEKVATRELAFPVEEQATHLQEIDYLNRKCDELLRKYRGMAEQSAMLEQSLLERNLLIQRWEEVLDAVDMPASIRLKEPEDKIRWLGTTVSDAQTSLAQFQAETEKMQTTMEALNNTLQKLQEDNVVLSMELTARTDELKTVAQDLEDMTIKCNSLSNANSERSGDGMPIPQAGLWGLEESEFKQGVRQQPQFQIEDSEAFVANIRTLLSEIMQGDELENIFSVGLSSTVLQNSVKLLVEKIKAWSTEAAEAKGKVADLALAMRMAENDREKELQNLHEALSSKLLELSDVTKQLESFAMKNNSLEDDINMLQKKVNGLSEGLSSVKDELSKSQLEASQLEDKLTSTREKLSMAVKKGKGVVQQRDALKQSLDEKITELSQLREQYEAENLAFTNAKQSLRHQLHQMETLQAELLSSRNYVSSLEKSMQESNRAIQKCAEAIDKISVPGAPHSGDLGEKIQSVSQLVFDLQRKAGVSEQDAKKSKRTTELLALELEEVQGRMDSLADELRHAEKNSSLLIEEKKLAEASKTEAGLRLEHAMANINSLLFELSESRENQANLEHENNSLKDSLSAQMEEFRYKQAKAEEQLKDKGDLYSKVYHLKASQSTLLGVVADQVFNSSEDVRGIKSLVLKISGELKDQGLISLLAAPMLADNSLSKWQPEKTIQEWKQGVTIGSLKLLCDEMETELQHFEDFFKSFVMASNQDSVAICQLLMEICDGLGPLSQRMLTLKRDADFVSSTESSILKKNEQISILEDALRAITERLRYSIKEMEDFKEESLGQESQNGTSSSHLLDSEVPYTTEKNLQAITFSLVERLSCLAKDLAHSHQQDDIQKERQNENLRNQLSKARAVIDAMDHQQQVDKRKNSELQREFDLREDSLKRTNQELSSLNDALSTVEQEKKGLENALDDAEGKIGELSTKVEELEKAKQELETSLSKASSRFYTTLSNFNKFQSLSEKLIEEAQSLHLLLEDRDEQILLLKDEVALKGSELTNLQNLVNEKTSDLSQIYQKIGQIVNRDAGSSESFPDSSFEKQTGSKNELLEAIASSIRAQTEGLQMQLARKDALLQDVQLRHDHLVRKVSMLESSLQENHRLMEERGHTSVIDHMMSSVEAEDKGNRGKHVTPSVAVVTHGRGGRKVSAPSNDLALDIDTESSRLLADMDDEDKGHVFKPLTSARLVPRGTHILVDRLDGLWVSGERLLRRRPGARLSVILYWLFLHVWMVASLL